MLWEQEAAGSNPAIPTSSEARAQPGDTARPPQPPPESWRCGAGSRKRCHLLRRSSRRKPRARARRFARSAPRGRRCRCTARDAFAGDVKQPSHTVARWLSRPRLMQPRRPNLDTTVTRGSSASTGRLAGTAARTPLPRRSSRLVNWWLYTALARANLQANRMNECPLPRSKKVL